MAGWREEEKRAARSGETKPREAAGEPERCAGLSDRAGPPMIAMIPVLDNRRRSSHGIAA